MSAQKKLAALMTERKQINEECEAATSRVDRIKEAVRLEIRSLNNSASEIVEKITRVGDSPPPLRFMKVRR